MPEVMITEREVNLYDKSDMFGVISGFAEQVEEALSIGASLDPPEELRKVENVIISGLGGSAIGGDLLKSYLRYSVKLPVHINRNYRLPEFAGPDTLVVVSSYSGNTEESLSSYEDARARNCRIVCLSSGGNLSVLAGNNGDMLIKIPSGYQPRCAIAFSFFPLLMFMSKLGFTEDRTQEVESIAVHFRKRKEHFTSLNENENSAIKLARYLKGRVPVIYSSDDLLDIVNLRWRGQISENAKTIAFGNLLPEMNHNEIVGWQENPELLKNLAVIVLKDRDDHPRILKRFGITVNLIKDLAAALIEVDGEGDTKLKRIFDLVHLGDWVSYYLAVLNKVDPTPVEKINILKNKLTEN